MRGCSPPVAHLSHQRFHDMLAEGLAGLEPRDDEIVFAGLEPRNLSEHRQHPLIERHTMRSAWLHGRTARDIPYAGLEIDLVPSRETCLFLSSSREDGKF